MLLLLSISLCCSCYALLMEGSMDFGKRLADFRKQRGLTQVQLADRVGVHIAQLRNYEANRSQPTLEVIRKLSLALSISADELVFDSSERLPNITDKDLIRSWERLESLPDEDRRVIKVIIEGLLCRHSIAKLNANL